MTRKGICVFWIPTIYHHEILPLQDQHDLEMEDISDEVGESRCKLSLKLRRDRNIEVIINIEGVGTFEFLLILKDAHRNGLFKYEFEVDVDWYELVEKALKNPIYHYVKGFYHKHLYHSNDSDSILDAFISEDTKVDLTTPDNPPLIHYLTQYEQRFMIFAEQLEFDAEYMESEYKKPEARKLVKDLYDEFYKKYTNIIGEVIYYHTLFNSRHNQSYRVKPCPKTEHESELYRQAHNTESAIERIHLIGRTEKEKFDNRRAHNTLQNILQSNEILKGLASTTTTVKELSEQSVKLQSDIDKALKESDKLSKRSVWLGVWSVILAVLSIVLCIMG